MLKHALLFTVVSSLFLGGCFVKFKTIKSSQIGVKRTFGEYKEKTLDPGLKVFFLGTRVIRIDLTPTMFSASQSARLVDGTKLTPTVNVHLKINPELVVPLLKERYSGNSRKISPYSFNSWIDGVLKESIALTSVKYNSFEEANANRDLYEAAYRETLTEQLKGYFLIDDVNVLTIKMTGEKARKLDEYSVLRQSLTNIELEIELAQRQITLDSLKAVAEKGTNTILQPSLTPEALERQRIQKLEGVNQNGQTIIIGN